MNYIKTRQEFLTEAYKGYASKDEYDQDYTLYQNAKDAYYNGDEPLMGDAEFDELEKRLGLENTGYVGTHHSENYTVQHPVKMGSLSKIQIKNTEEDNTIHFDEYMSALLKYFSNVPDYGTIEVTPKFDGCSFEIVWNDKGDIESISTRGDGKFGKDIRNWVEPKIAKIPYEQFIQSGKKLVVRGEILLDFDTFNASHVKDFANTRSFVSGMLGQDWENNQEQQNNRNDISIVVYDFRLVSPSGSYQWVDYNDIIKRTDDMDILGYNILTCKKSELDDIKFSEIYSKMEDLRKTYKFPLDGFVLKPEIQYRKTEDITRPSDCVAIKFLPTVLETEILDIEWNVGKTMELYPKAIFRTIVMDGKKINKASLHNYGYVVDKRIGVGSIIKVSLAGDIIPFVYGVVSTGGDNNAPTSGVTIDGPHLMLDMNENDKIVLKVKAGANALNIRGFKDATINKIIPEFISDDDAPDVKNILDLMKDESLQFITSRFGSGTSITNIISSLKQRRTTLTLSEIILAQQYKLCGHTVSELCAKYISGSISDAGLMGVSSVVKQWLTNPESDERTTIMRYVTMFNVNIQPQVTTSTDAIPVIMTGSPKEFGYLTKSTFLQAHPEYIETSDWKNCKILFTDDLSSGSSKMKKAEKLGIDVKTYDQA